MKTFTKSISLSIYSRSKYQVANVIASSLQDKIWLILCLFLCYTAPAQNPNTDFFQIATSNSTLDWIEIKPELQLRLEAFLTQKAALGLSPDDGFLLLKTQTDELGKTHYRYQQTYKNIPVTGAQLLIHVGKSGFVETANGRLIRNLQGKPTPAFSAEKALKAYALPYIDAQEYAWENEAHQKMIQKIKKDSKATFYPEGKLEWASSNLSSRSPDNYQLSYQMDIYALRPLKNMGLYIDAQTGEIINELTNMYDVDSLATGKTNYACIDSVEFHTQNYENQSQIFTLDNEIGGGIHTYKLASDGNSTLPFFNFGDNHWTNHKSAVDVHWAMEQTYHYFLNTHNRNSLNGEGMPIIGVIDPTGNTCNAFWNKTIHRPFFGAGGTSCNYNSPTSADIVAHELAHGITQFSANLNYEGESGALNESFSDIFGVMVHFEADPECADWVIGNEVYTYTGGIRDLSNPEGFDHPNTYKGLFWKNTETCNPSPSNDKCGVHTNSGVQNYWFYLLAEGGSGTNDKDYDYDITGIGKEKAAKIAYRNLTSYLGPTSDYTDARAGSLQAAKDLYGLESVEYQTVLDTWCAVGVVGTEACTLLEASLQLLTPNNSPIWKAGTVQGILWNSEKNEADDISGVNIEYSLNGGASWQTIVVGTDDDGSYNWQIPLTLSTTTAKIRITASNDLTIRDESDIIFSIEACNVVAGFISDTYHICVGETIDFENTSVNMNDFKWDINGSMMATSTDFSHTFNEAGTFIINLAGTEGTDEDACGDGFYEIVEVSDGPTAHFNYQINYSNVNFSATASLQETTYTWDFGDSQTGNGINPTHTYTDSGEYTICLTTMDNCGSTESCQTIVVEYACLVSDSLELVKFYHATRGGNWANNSGWLEKPVSEWFGVTLSADGCYVDSLSFYNNRLYGELPDLKLSKLTFLNLERNKLHGTIPDFSNLPNLIYLNLGVNRISGTIPDFSNLPDLIHLNLWVNRLHDTIPDFSNLSNLNYLNLGYNGLSSTIPNFSNLPNLTDLELSGNQLRETIPDFSNLPSLTNLNLSYNQLSGTIPDFSNLPNLTLLYLQNNELSGVIPNFSNLPNLTFLWLHANQFSGIIPNLSNLSSLKSLRIADNSLNFEGLSPNLNYFNTNLDFTFFSYHPQDPIPIYQVAESFYVSAGGDLENNTYWWYELGTPIAMDTIVADSTFTPPLNSTKTYYCEVTNNIATQLTLTSLPISNHTPPINCLTADSLALVELFLSTEGFDWIDNNGWLTTPINEWFGVTVNNCNIDSLSLENNNLVGEVANFNLPNLSFLNLANNHLSGTIPDFSNLPNLTSLELRSNQLNSTIPDFSNLPNLTYLNLSDNQLSGAIPDFSNLSNLIFLHLGTFYLDNNQLSGFIPDFSNLPNLTNLELGGNQLSGTIPDFSNLPNLTNLNLWENQLSGTIPDFSNLPNLTHLDLSDNRLHDIIPNFSNLPNLTHLQLGANQLSGSIPDFSNLPDLTSLYLGANQLSGTIPDFSNLPDLTDLFLAYNQLSGSVPNFSNLPDLTFLQLGVNQLSGTIPDFSNLPNLTHLLLYVNQLNGIIPDFSNSPDLIYVYLHSNHLIGTISDFSHLTKLANLDLHENKFTFEGIEQSISNNTNFYTFNYYPQSVISTHQVGNLLYVSAGGTLSNNTYTWYEEGNSTPISVITADSTFTLPETAIGKTYHCEVSNSIATNLTLTSEPYTITDLTMGCLASDSLELVKFYYATGGDNWINNSGWLVEPVSEWYGVKLSEYNCKVDFLLLHENNLVGELPDLKISTLTSLWLHDNQLSGNIPDFSGLTSLVYLSLQDNQLSGNIPDFSSLPNLKYLYIDDNQLNGSIPDFSGLSNLQDLQIYNNQLSGNIPDFSNLPNLNSLLISSNQLNGTIPDFSNLPNLNSLSLGHNELNGTIPDFSNLPNLNSLSLGSNELNGTIPDFSNLPNLVGLYLYGNQLNGNIPDFSNLPILTILNLSRNFLSGTIPDFSNLPILNQLGLYNNQLSGSIPNLINVPNLAHLSLQNNQLSGSIPDFSNFPNLKNLHIENNKLTFEGLSSNLDYFNTNPNFTTFLYYPQALIPVYQENGNFYVSAGGNVNNNTYWWYELDNSIAIDTIETDSTFIPPPNSAKTYYCKVTNNIATELTLSSLPISNYIPPNNCLTADSLTLVELFMATEGINWTNNDGWLTAPIEDWFGVTVNNCNIESLFLQDNGLKGTLSNLNLPNLTYLSLNDNQLSGTIPDFSNLPNLTNLSLGYNQLSGNIPNFSNLPNLTYLSLQSNQLNGTIPNFTNLLNLTSLNLQANQLSGMIPNFTDLPNLTILNLSFNQLSGAISNFSNSPNLAYLYLRSNELSGTIPNLSNLPNLAYVFLSNNSLTFSGLAQNVNYFYTNPTFSQFYYSPQSTIPTHQTGNQLYVSAGGTYENNTYTWYRVGNPTPISEATDSIFTVTDFSKNYYCKITNSIATNLTLISEPTSIIECSISTSFDISTDNICEDIPTIFTNTSTNATTFQWQINGTNYSTNPTFLHTFLEAGNYTLQLIATNDVFCSDTLIQNILVHQNAESIDLDIGEDKYLCDNQVLLSANVSNMAAYSWSLEGEPVGSGLTFEANETGEYTLEVTDYCDNQKTDTLFVLLDNDCVWSGDFNYDGVVNVYDLLPYGVHFGATGFIRENASLNWLPQPCLDWNGETEEHQSNLKHIDGNGNGVIEGNDTTAILHNYSKVHGISDPLVVDNSIVLDLKPSSQDNNVLEEHMSTYIVDLDMYKDLANEVTAYGLAFTLEYNFEPADVMYVKLNLDESWLGNTNTDLQYLTHWREDDGEVDIAITRTDHQGRTGSGSLGILEFMIDNYASNDTIEPVLKAHNVQLSSSIGNLMSINSESQTNTLYAPSCWDTLRVHYTATNHFIRTFTQGPDTIQIGDTTTLITLPSGKRTYFQAKKNIEILPGTEIKHGSVFGAKIGDCTTEGGKQAEEDTDIISTSNELQLQVAPNPFSTHTSINYFLPTDTPVNLSIYDIHGRIVKHLFRNETQKAGQYTLDYTPCNNMTTGVYFCKIEAGEWQKTVKIVKSN